MRYEVDKQLLAALSNINGAKLLAVFGMFVNKPGSFELPFDVDGKPYVVNGIERMVVFGKIVEELGRRLDAAPAGSKA